MTKFYAYLEQSQGCDYTIGCGKKLVEIPGAVDVLMAQAWVFDEYGSQLGGTSEFELSRVTILAVSESVQLDIKAFAAAKRAADEQAAAAAKADAERAEFERLKKKFEGS